MNLTITLTGKFPGLLEEELESLLEALQDDCKMYYGGQAVTAEVEKS